MHSRPIVALHAGICSFTLIALLVALAGERPNPIFAQGSSSDSSSSETSSSSESSSSTTSSSSDTSEFDCQNLIDDDTDGNTDCDDSDCDDDEACSAETSDAEQNFPIKYCGDHVCSNNGQESCATCPSDCGLCVETEAPVCGDLVCEESENCLADCAPFMEEEIIQELFRDPVPATIDIDTIEHAPTESIEETLASLSRIVKEDQRFQERLAQKGTAEITASLMGEDNLRQIARYISQITEALREEAADVRRTVLHDLFLSPSVAQLMRTLPQKEEIVRKAKEGNLIAVYELLPEPRESVELRLLEVEEYDTLLREQYSDAFDALHTFRVLPVAFADEHVRGSADAKDGFMDSAFLRKRMESLGIDPRTGLPSLEQDIENLSKRKNTLAGIIGIVESDVEENIDDAKENLQEPSTRSLINIMGIFSYIRTTANFDALEETYGNAVARMNTGFQKVQSLFVWNDISPRAEASELLGEEITDALASADLHEKKSAVISLMQSQEYVVHELLNTLPEENREAHVRNLSKTEEEVNLARNVEDLERAIGSYSNTLTVLESEARLQHGFMKRIIFEMQDFFGRSS